MVSRTIKICNKIMRLVRFNSEHERISSVALRSIVLREAGGDRRTIDKYMGIDKKKLGFLFSLGYLKIENQRSFKILRDSISNETPPIRKKEDGNIEKYGEG